MSSIFILPFQDIGGGIKPADGAKLLFWATDVVTPKDTFTTEAATIAHSNPVIADSLGVFPEIWLVGEYVAVLTDKDDVQIWQSQPFESSLTNAVINDQLAEIDAQLAQTPITKDTIAAAKADEDLVNSAGSYVDVVDNDHGETINSRYKINLGAGTDDGFSVHNSDTAALFNLTLEAGTEINLAVANVDDSIADNSTQIQTVIDYLTARGGGIIESDFSKRYPFQIPIDMKAGVTWRNTKLTADLTGNPDYAIGAIGTLGASTLITANVDEGDTVLVLTNVSGFTEGSHLLIKDPTRLGGRWPYTTAEIVDITALNVTIKQPVGVGYLLANSCTVEPMAAVIDAHLENIETDYSSTGTSKFCVHFQNAVDCSAPGLRITNHAYTSNPTACVSFRGDNLLNFRSSSSTISQNTNTIGGNAMLMFALTSSEVDNVFAWDCNFGVGLWNSYGLHSKGHIVSGKAASGNRGAKMAGCQQCKFDGITVNKFDSGIKVEDCGMFGILDSTVSNCGIGGSFGINVSHANATSSADIRPSTISGNNVFNIDGTGIFVDANSFQTVIDGNTTRQTTAEGILSLAPNVTITDNFIYDWQAGAGIRFVGNNVVTGNQVIGLTVSTDSFELHTQPGDTDWTVFTNNTGSTHGITTNLAYFEKIAVMNGNAILGLGNRIMLASAAPVAGTFTRSDRVYHNNATAGATMGWVCTSSGTPGTWKSFGAINV